MFDSTELFQSMQKTRFNDPLVKFLKTELANPTIVLCSTNIEEELKSKMCF